MYFESYYIYALCMFIYRCWLPEKSYPPVYVSSNLFSGAMIRIYRFSKRKSGDPSTNLLVPHYDRKILKRRVFYKCRSGLTRKKNISGNVAQSWFPLLPDSFILYTIEGTAPTLSLLPHRPPEF